MDSAGYPESIGEPADRAIATGQFEQAITLYQAVMATDPNAVWPLGIAYLLAGDPETAQGLWFEAIALHTPEVQSAAWKSLWQTLQREGDRQLQQRRFGVAERAYQQALELEVAPTLWQALGWAIAQQGRYDEGIACWQEAITLEPDWVAGYQAQAETHQHLGEWSRAIAALQFWLALQPTAAPAHHRLGQCFWELGEITGAIAQFQHTLSLLAEDGEPHDPPTSHVWGDLGMAFFWQGDAIAAIQAWRQTLALQPLFVADLLAWLAANGQAAGSLLHQNQTLLHAIQAQDEATVISILAPRLGQQRSDPGVPSVAGSTIPAPVGYYETTLDWVKGVQSGDGKSGDGAIAYTPIYPPTLLSLTPPRSLQTTLHPSFCFGTAVPLPGSFVVQLPNGRYWIEETRQVAAIAPDNRILGDLSPFSPILSPGHPAAHPQRHPLLQQATLPLPQTIDGTVAVISGLSNGVYFHWMLDVLPRLALLQQAGIDLQTIDYFLVDASLPFQQETLKTLGISLSKTLAPARYPHIQARSLLLPSFPASISWMPPWSLNFLRQTFLPAPPTPSRRRRLYISRSKASVRRLINEAALLPILAAFGFETLHLETLTVAEQAQAFAEAEAVVGVHGSGLTNLVFCPPGIPVIELFSPQYVYPCFWLVANGRSLSYFAVLGEHPEGLHLQQAFYPDARQADLWVRPQTLYQALELADIRPLQP